MHKKADISSSLVISTPSWKMRVALTPSSAEEDQALLDKFFNHNTILQRASINYCFPPSPYPVSAVFEIEMSIIKGPIVSVCQDCLEPGESCSDTSTMRTPAQP